MEAKRYYAVKIGKANHGIDTSHDQTVVVVAELAETPELACEYASYHAQNPEYIFEAHEIVSGMALGFLQGWQ